MFADEIRRAIDKAARVELPQVAKVMWSAFTAGQITEPEAEALSGLIEARKVVPAIAATPRKPVGSRPRTDASLERRRRWAASGHLPPQVADKFTQGEVAALAVVTTQVAKHEHCTLTLAHIADLAGVSVSTVKRAIREAKALGFITATERRVSAWRNDSTVLVIVSREWLAWIDRGGRRGGGGHVRTGLSTGRQEGLPNGRLGTASGDWKGRSGSKINQGERSLRSTPVVVSTRG